ncbi:MAG TPA: hypothetical protein VGI10_24755 [Polyangiaceae bacterium]
MAESRPSQRPAGAMPRRQPNECDLLIGLAELPHYSLRIDRGCSLFVAQRTSLPFRDAAEITKCFDQVERELSAIPRKVYSLLVDTRRGPLRNDPAFEAALGKERGKLLFGFRKNAALTRTAAGCMQIERFARIDGRTVCATPDPAVAFEYLGLPLHAL